MVKRIFLKEEQINFINNAMAEQKLVPSEIVSALEGKDTYIPLNDINFSKKLLAKQYNKVKSEFSDDITQVPLKKVMNRFSKLLTLCEKKETNIRPQLEKLCYNTVVTLFNIPDDEIYFKIELVDNIDAGTEFHFTPNTDEGYEYENIDEINSEAIDVEKRRLVNMLVMGGSMELAEKAKSIYLNELFDIDEELPHLYSKLIKLNNYLLFNNNVENKDGNHNQGGFVKITLGNEEKMTQIEIKALTFPILLSESIKGLLELISSIGLPDELNKAKDVVDKADILSEEPWDMRFGRELWNIITLDNKVETKLIPDFFRKLIDIDSNEFIGLMKELVSNTKQGKKVIEELIDDCKYHSEYSDFEKDVMQKQDDKSLISDEYFTEDELMGNF